MQQFMQILKVKAFRMYLKYEYSERAERSREWFYEHGKLVVGILTALSIIALVDFLLLVIGFIIG